MKQPQYPLNRSRPLLSGEDETPRAGFQVFVCCHRDNRVDGACFDSIWARSVDEARRTWFDYNAGMGLFLYDVTPLAEFRKAVAA